MVNENKRNKRIDHFSLKANELWSAVKSLSFPKIVYNGVAYWVGFRDYITATSVRLASPPMNAPPRVQTFQAKFDDCQRIQKVKEIINVGQRKKASLIPRMR